MSIETRIPTVAHLDAVQCILSRASWRNKVDTLLKSLCGGATRGEVEAFLQKRRNLDELLRFISIYRADRPSLPLSVLVHIRHYLFNPYVDPQRTLPLECTQRIPKWWSLPDNLRYVMARVPIGHTYDTPCGICLMNREAASHLVEEYRTGSEPESIWHRPDATIIGTSYMGMGHFLVIALCTVSGAEGMFEFHEGGSNGWDRDDNNKRARALKVDTLQRIPDPPRTQDVFRIET